MTLSDHLDMVGVTLMASWVKTRKANGDALQLNIKKILANRSEGLVIELLCIIQGVVQS
jgi:hypothetical protein